MPRINHFSESVFTVQGHGVHTAFVELAQAQAALGCAVGVNEAWRDGILHVHTVGPLSLVRLLRHNGLRCATAHVTAASLRGSIRGARSGSLLIRWYLRFFYNRTDILFSVSRDAAEELHREGVARPICVVPNGICPTPFLTSEAARGTARAALGAGADDFVVLNVAQVQPRKGVGVFIECARRLPDCRFIWVGGFLFGPLSAHRWRLARLMRTAPSNVSFVGQQARDKVVQYYRAADVFLFPSSQETFGLAPVEAAFAGVPLVLSDLPVFAEVFGGPEPTYQAALDVDGLAAAIQRLRLNESERRVFSARARESVARYSSDRVAELVIEVYYQLVRHSGFNTFSSTAGREHELDCGEDGDNDRIRQSGVV